MMSDIFYWPAFIGIVGALALTVILVTLLLLFKEQAIRVACLLFLSGLVSMGAGYFCCAAYFLLTEWNGPIAQKLLANVMIALIIPSPALAPITLLVALPAVAQAPL